MNLFDPRRSIVQQSALPYACQVRMSPSFLESVSGVGPLPVFATATLDLGTSDVEAQADGFRWARAA
jgi:hypothetical protein